MKKFFCLFFVFISIIFCSCVKAEEELNWKDYFQVSYQHIEESKFDNDYDKVDALINGTFIFEHEEYTIANKTNEVLKGVYLVFDIEPLSKPTFQIQKYVGTLQQGEVVVEELSQTLIEINYGQIGYLDDEIYEVSLVDIVFEIKK